MTWDETCRILEESQKTLSRSAKGESHTEASASKRPLLLEGEALAHQVEANARALYALLRQLKDQPAPTSTDEVRARLRSIEDTVNRSLLPMGRFRSWEPSSTKSRSSAFDRFVPWQEVPQALEALECELFARWGSIREDPVPTAAWLEWTIQGPLHPYYDGCGRISRGFSAHILTWAGHPVPRYEDREEWFRRAREGLESFTRFVRECASGTRPGLTGGSESVPRPG